PVGGAQLGGEFLHHLGPAGDEDQRVAAGGELTGQAHADAGGGSGDHGAGLGGGGGQGHGGDLLRSAPAQGGGGRSGSVREHRLDRLALIHHGVRAVDLGERHGAVEHQAGEQFAGQHVRQQLVDVG